MTPENPREIFDDHVSVLGELPHFDPEPSSSALLVIDVQYMDAHPDFGIGPTVIASSSDQGKYYFDRLRETVIPNISALLEECRALGMPIMHTRNVSFVSGRRDLPWRRKFVAPEVLLDSREADFLEEVAPQPGELVFNKSTASALNSTNLEFAARNMGVDTLITTGVVTNMCVESSVRDAGDRGFRVLLVEDACAAMTEAEHDYAVALMDRRFANAVSTDNVIEALRRS